LGNPLSLIFALSAAVLYGSGNALEHRVAADADGDVRLGVGLLGRLVRSPFWILGMIGDVGAYGFQAAALALGTLVFVQPLLVCGLLVALPLNAHWTHRRIRAREWVAATVLCASLTTFLIEAAPGGGNAQASFESWLRVGGAILVLVLAAVATAAVGSGHVRAALLGFAAGALFGLTAALTKTFVSQIQHGVGYTASHWEVYALAVLSLAGILFTQHGFQAASLSASLPALEASEPVTAVIVGIVLLHEHLNGRTGLADVVIGVSIVALVVSVVMLASIAGHDAALVDAASESPRSVDTANTTGEIAIKGRDRYRPRRHEARAPHARAPGHRR
jgi:drug/metabolite transporter (DMT)-like permease